LSKNLSIFNPKIITKLSLYAFHTRKAQGNCRFILVPYLTLPQVGVNLLEDGNAEGGRFAGSRLRLGDHVHSLA
jgi:hypothetical protein